MSEENTLSRLVYIGQALANNIKHIHLHATGSDFDFIHNTAQEYYEELSDEIDDFSEIAISKGEKVDNLNNLRSNLEDDFWAEPLTDEMYDMEAFVAYMQEAGTKWIKGKTILIYTHYLCQCFNLFHNFFNIYFNEIKTDMNV